MKNRRPDPPDDPPIPVVFRWDLDKTYLQTDFESLRKLVRIPFERAEDKVALPGVVPLIRALKQSGRATGRDVRIHFISASPPQIGDTIREKLRLDGVEYDDIVFKDQWQNIRRGKFRNLREQIGYKLTELLSSRPTMPASSQEVLFGDDWESDPIIYSLYADVLNGRLSADELRQILESVPIDPELVERSVGLCPQAPADVVTRIFINLERRVPLANFEVFGRRLVPAFNYLQTAACLFQEGYLTAADVAAVAHALVDRAGYTPERLANSLADIERRAHLSRDSATSVRTYLLAEGLLPTPTVKLQTEPRRWWQRLRERWRQLVKRLRNRWERGVASAAPPLPAPQIDYRALVAEWRSKREGAHA